MCQVHRVWWRCSACHKQDFVDFPVVPCARALRRQDYSTCRSNNNNTTTTTSTNNNDDDDDDDDDEGEHDGPSYAPPTEGPHRKNGNAHPDSHAGDAVTVVASAVFHAGCRDHGPKPLHETARLEPHFHVRPATFLPAPGTYFLDAWYDDRVADGQRPPGCLGRTRWGRWLVRRCCMRY
jgi:hypothetical protein